MIDDLCVNLEPAAREDEALTFSMGNHEINWGCSLVVFLGSVIKPEGK
jgi:hypothetical protein